MKQYVEDRRKYKVVCNKPQPDGTKKKTAVTVKEVNMKAAEKRLTRPLDSWVLGFFRVIL